MAKEKLSTVTMRVRVGETEFEVTGPSDFVEKKIAEFLKTPLPKPSTAIAKGQASSSEPAHATNKSKSPAQFFRSINPKTDTDRVLLALYFLEKFRNVQSATAAEVKELIKEAKWPPPGNTNESINKNIRKGLLMTAGDREGKIAFVLTSDGETTVDEMVNESTG